jgi:hypothetical protein
MSLIPGVLPSGACYGTPQELLDLFSQYLTVPAFAVSSKVLYSATSPSPNTGFVWINTAGGDTPLLNLYNDATGGYEPFPFVGGVSSNEKLISDKTAITTLVNSDLLLVGTLGGGSYSSLKKITWANMAGQIPSEAITFPMLSNIAAEASNVAKRVAKAWVNFNGTGTVAIRDDFNVSSITDNGTGDYTINFSTAMSNANYAFATHGFDGTLDAYMNSWGVGPSFAQTTTSIRLQCTNDFVSTGYVTDIPNACVTIFGS